jgi:short-subunit dehydrogenase
MKNKVVVITGASSGIGLACAREFASKGSSVVLAARNYELIEKYASEMNSRGLVAFPVKTDVTVEDDCMRLMESVAGRFGQIDVLINNAGISMRALFSDVDLKVLKQLMDVNFWGMVYCSRFALPFLLRSKGTIAGISSIAGFHGLPGRTGYSASKFAMHGFLEALRIENLKTGLHVLIAAPGFTSSNIRKTALVADGSSQGESPRQEEKMMPAEEVAKHIYKAILKRKRSLVLTSQGKSTVLLKKIAPALLDKLVYKHLANEPDSPFKNRT